MRIPKLQHSAAKAALLLMFAAASSQAAIVTYTFFGIVTSPAPEPVGFHLTLSTFVSVPSGGATNYTNEQLDLCINCKGPGWVVAQFEDYGWVDPNYQAVLQFDAINSGGYWDYTFYFPTGAFTKPGFYTADAGYYAGTLAVTESSVVPEPASVLMAMGGLCLLGLARFRARP